MVKKLTLFGFLVVVLLSVSLYYMSQDGQFEGDSFLISFSDSLNYHDDAKIIVMDQGRLVGFDTHEELLINNNVYKELFSAWSLVS